MPQFLAQPREWRHSQLEQKSGAEHFGQFQPQKKSSSQLKVITVREHDGRIGGGCDLQAEQMTLAVAGGSSTDTGEAGAAQGWRPGPGPGVRGRGDTR